jgi:hypothetical protein
LVSLLAISALVLLLTNHRVMCQQSPSETTGKRPNHLINEKSPYLLQHAYNPVDWYPWGEEALRKLVKRTSRSFFPSVIQPVTGAM